MWRSQNRFNRRWVGNNELRGSWRTGSPVFPALSDSARVFSSGHSTILWRLHHSQFCQRPRRQDWPLNLSRFSCVGDFTCPFSCRCAPANVAATTIVLRAWFWRKGAAHCAAQVCREAGARVSANVLVRDLDLVAHNNLDGRQLEVIAHGLTLWHSAQMVIDTTLVSPLRRDGSARARAADHLSAVLFVSCGSLTQKVSLFLHDNLVLSTFPQLDGHPKSCGGFSLALHGLRNIKLTGFAFAGTIGFVAIGEPSLEVASCPFDMALCFPIGPERKLLKWMQKYVEKLIMLNKRKRLFLHVTRETLFG